MQGRGGVWWTESAWLPMQALLQQFPNMALALRRRPGMQGLGGVLGNNGAWPPAQALLQQFPNLAPALQAQTLAMVQQFQLAQQQAAAAAAAGAPTQSAPRPAVQAAQARAPPAPAVLGLPWRCGGRWAPAALTARPGSVAAAGPGQSKTGWQLQPAVASARVTQCRNMSSCQVAHFLVSLREACVCQAGPPL